MKDELGPLIGLVIFVITTAVFGLFAWQKQTALLGEDPNGSQSKQREIDKLRVEISSLEADVADYTLAAELLREKIREQQDRRRAAQANFQLYDDGYKYRQQMEKEAEKLSASATELSAQLTQMKTASLEKINKETSEARDNMERQIREKTEAKEAAIARARQDSDAYKSEEISHRKALNYQNSTFDDAKSTLADLTQRDPERATVLNEIDGRVILSDTVQGTCVIDIGTANGVKNGFRFEVFTLKPGGERLRKAFIEVTRASAGRSECIVMKRPVLMPTDPLSNYVAHDPEEQYSPEQESGRAESSAQLLSGKPREVLLGFNKNAQVVEGDYIQNPFLNTRKTLTVYIAGSKEMANDVQKSAIRYSWREIQAQVVRHGGKVVTQPDVGVDYVVAQKNPRGEGTDQEKAEFQRVIELGLPLLYEWELFRFLDQR